MNKKYIFVTDDGTETDLDLGHYKSRPDRPAPLFKEFIKATKKENII